MSRARWKIAGAFVRPKAIFRYSYEPMWQVKAVLPTSSGGMGICQYPALQSSVQKTRASPSESMQSSIRGMG